MALSKPYRELPELVRAHRCQDTCPLPVESRRSRLGSTRRSRIDAVATVPTPEAPETVVRLSRTHGWGMAGTKVWQWYAKLAGERATNCQTKANHAAELASERKPLCPIAFQDDSKVGCCVLPVLLVRRERRSSDTLGLCKMIFYSAVCSGMGLEWLDPRVSWLMGTGSSGHTVVASLTALTGGVCGMVSTRGGSKTCNGIGITVALPRTIK